MMYPILVVILLILALWGLHLMYRINKRENLIDETKIIAGIGLTAGFVGWFFSVAAIETKPFNITYALVGSIGVVICLCIWMHIRGLWEKLFTKCGV